MKKRINDLIPPAMKAVKDNLEKNNVVLGVYKGYIASFGSGMIGSGLLATIAMFHESTSSKADRKKLLSAIFQTAFPGAQGDLFTYLLQRQGLSLYREESLITDAVIAIKLALRTFNLTDETE